jgi:hypothetical protein
MRIVCEPILGEHVGFRRRDYGVERIIVTSLPEQRLTNIRQTRSLSTPAAAKPLIEEATEALR